MRNALYALLLVLALFPPQPVRAQCSNGKVTFKTYSSIEYRVLPRTARMEADLRANLMISCCGNAGSRLSLTDLAVFHTDGTKFEDKEPSIWFRLSLEEAVASWRILNETGVEQSLPLLVEFRLAGAKPGDGAQDQRNLVMFKDDGLVIRIIGTVPRVDLESSRNHPAPGSV